jgi:hypothetical protein
VIVIEAGTEVSGKLVDAEGRPVPRAWVPIRGARELDGFQGFDYLTDGEGRFRIPDVGPGTFLIEPEDAAQRITIVPGTRVPELQLEVSRDD